MNLSRQNGYPPTVREIGTAVGLSSPASVLGHLRSLERAGFIRRGSSKRRALEVVEEALQVALAGTSEGSPDLIRCGETWADAAGSNGKAADAAAGLRTLCHGVIGLQAQVVRLPIVGRVAAGRPILAQEDVDGLVEVPAFLAQPGDCFILRVKGLSMVKAGILDGDLVVVRRQDTAENGDIVVAILDDEATVKRFFREKDRVRLQPENDDMEPIFVRNPIIAGKVVGVMRRLG